MNFNFSFLFLFFLIQISNSLTYQPNHNFNSYFHSLRYYDSKLCEFIQPDIKIPKGPHHHLSLNRYLYTFANPLKYSDPDGHSPQDSSNENGVLKLIRQKLQTADQRLSRAFRKYLSKNTSTKVAILNKPDIPNAGPRIAEALQKLAGNQATIHAKRHNDTAWFIEYEQRPENFSDRNHSNRTWLRLKRVLDASESQFKKAGALVFVELLTPDSQEGRNLIDRGIEGWTQKSKGEVPHIRIRALIDLKEHSRQQGLEYLGDLSLTLGHELKHARDIIENKQTRHFDTPAPYIFYDDPNFVEDILYLRAHNENVPEKDQVPELLSQHPYLAGLATRKAFKSMGIYPTKMKPREKK